MADVATKNCPLCRKEKPETDFKTAHRTTLASHCQRCRDIVAGRLSATPMDLPTWLAPAITCHIHSSKDCVKCYPPIVIANSPFRKVQNVSN